MGAQQITGVLLDDSFISSWVFFCLLGVGVLFCSWSCFATLVLP